MGAQAGITRSGVRSTETREKKRKREHGADDTRTLTGAKAQAGPAAGTGAHAGLTADTMTDHGDDGTKTLTGAKARAGPVTGTGALTGLTAKTAARADAGAPATKVRKPRSAKGKETNARRTATRFGGQGKA